jgi:hypothetical protein
LVRRAIKYGIVIVVVGFLTIQVVPYGRSHDNPPVISEPEWDTPITRDLAVRACFDCHSNETYWPWYTKVAPLSWWTQDHVDEGRDELNFSEWSWTNDEVDEIAESVMDGEMPPTYYDLVPGSRKLSAQEQELLIQGLVSTFNDSPNAQCSSDHDDDDDHDDHRK